MGRPFLIILLVVLAVVAVYAFTRPAPQDTTTSHLDVPAEPLDPDIAEAKKLLSERDLAGDDPADPPKLNLQIEVDPNPDKQALIFTITEEHGYYVETFNITYWKKGFESKPLYLFVNKYLKAGDTLEFRTSLIPIEIEKNAGGDIGTSDDWEGTISFDRARTENPDPLPIVSGD